MTMAFVRATAGTTSTMLGKPLARGGTATSGYEICIDRTLRLMHLKIRGFWQLAAGQAYRDAGIAGAKLMASGGPWYLLGDIRGYPSQQDAVQQCHAELLRAAQGSGLIRVAHVVDNVHGNMQFRRLAGESGLQCAFFTSEPEALTWLGSGSS